MNGHVAKDHYANALQSHQVYLNEIKSDQRDKAAALRRDGCSYYWCWWLFQHRLIVIVESEEVVSHLEYFHILSIKSSSQPFTNIHISWLHKTNNKTTCVSCIQNFLEQWICAGYTHYHYTYLQRSPRYVQTTPVIQPTGERVRTCALKIHFGCC